MHSLSSRESVPSTLPSTLPLLSHHDISSFREPISETFPDQSDGAGFGASPLGRVFGPVSEHDAISSVREAFRLGINFFDTCVDKLQCQILNLGLLISAPPLAMGLPTENGPPVWHPASPEMKVCPFPP
ncbi:L-galactose dehydrogenase family protein [Salix suchowensis]|nr:L-galactose dehydrogenase family protein [Salix suchowensis]